MYIRRPCGCRCVQYSILGGKAQGVRAIFLRQWIFSFLVGQGGEETRTRRGLPLAEPTDHAATVPGGVACLLCRLLPLPLACFIAPIPPTPFPSGEGGDQGYFMQGASPLASPALDRPRHLQTLPKRHPVGGLLSLSPAVPAVSCLCRPHPPDPRSQSALPGGKGETKVISCKGRSPLHPRH